MSDIQLVGTLDLKDGCPEDVTRFLELASVDHDSALKLEALYLSVSDQSREYELQKTLLWTNLPSLQHLCLVNVLIPEELPLLPSVVFLQVIKTPDQDGYLSVQWLFSNLPKVPNVKDLDLARIIGSFDDVELPDTKISLPYLKEIDLDCDDSTQLSCLDFIDFPTSTIVKLSVAWFCDYYDDENFAAVYNLWKRSGAEHIDLSIGQRNVMLSLYDTKTALEQSGPRLTCQLSAPLDEEGVALLDDQLPLSEITCLTLSIAWTRNLDFLSDLFPLLDGVTTLKTEPGELARIFKCIEACLPDVPPPFLALRVLDVDTWRFGDIALIESFVEQCKGRSITITHIILAFGHPLCRTHWDISKLESMTHVEWRPKYSIGEGVGNTL
ncbi:hypothetical protein ONZ45_g3606 [Pleurotus djamor]|nr:hypothetical protein ONZ45_g3606 [Pleurotus djamor]